MLSLGSGAAAPSVPEIRLTPTEAMSGAKGGAKGESQMGSFKLAGVDTQTLA